MSTKNGMEPHIRKTIMDMDADILGLNKDITRLVSARETLVDLYSGDEEIPAAPVADKKLKAVRVPRQPRAAATVVGAGRGRAPSAESVKVMAVMRSAPEPFTLDSLRVASGIENSKSISNALTRGKAKGWLESAGRGEYKRTKDFPSTTE